MRRSVWYRIFLSGSVASVTLGLLLFFVPDRPIASPSIPPASPSQITALAGDIGLPVAIVIPSLGVNAPIEPVGLTPARAMEVPERADIVGWYRLGARPGERGNAVLSAHYDTVLGTPGIFFGLQRISVGDEIHIIDNAGGKRTFRVSERVIYGVDEVPLRELFGPSSVSMLNLITCDGLWDAARGMYDRRLVVRSSEVMSATTGPWLE